MTQDPESTDRNWRARLVEAARTADAHADPIIDRALVWTAASGWSPVIVLAYTLACILAGWWIGAKP